MTATALKPSAFIALLLLAVMFASNHVAARIAFDHGVDVRHRGGGAQPGHRAGGVAAGRLAARAARAQRCATGVSWW